MMISDSGLLFGTTLYFS